MKKTIKIGIVGYGNLGKGVELAAAQCDDIELVAVFSRRELAGTQSGVPAVSLDKITEYQGKIDVMVLCGGSATDLEVQGPLVAQYFNTIDSFDTHAKIPTYFASMDKTSKKANTVSIISVGWDPGLFSLNRLLASAVLPNGQDYTFWGKGVSQGHSDAIRRIVGVKNAKQYTIPKEEVVNAIRSGECPAIKGNEVHLRDCYVVAEDGADLTAIEAAIKTMPNYFVGYETIVHFISETEFNEKHTGIPHGGFVFRNGQTSPGTNHVIEFALKLDSNPEFTSSVLVAYARAAYRLKQHGGSGASTVFDIPFAWLSPKSGEELRKELL
ncbi:diaminopimelate dehydrogenase [Anaerosinus sp.]